MKKLIIIKLGGSILTEKSQTEAILKTEVITSLSKQISDLYNSNKYQIVLVHGAGSFGHPLAKKYKLNQEVKTKMQKFGLVLTQHTILELNLLLTESLLDNKVPAISLPPHSFIKQKDGKVDKINLVLVKEYLKGNYMPVLYGDVVLDDKLGASIISGDIVTSCLAQYLEVEKVVFLTDVDGIFDSNPKTNPRAKLIPYVSNLNLQEVLRGISAHNPNDVTLEMKGKLLGIQKHLSNVEVIIANGLKENAITNALAGKGARTQINFKLRVQKG